MQRNHQQQLHRRCSVVHNESVQRTPDYVKIRNDLHKSKSIHSRKISVNYETIAPCEKRRDVKSIKIQYSKKNVNKNFEKNIKDIDNDISNKQWTVPDMTEFLPSGMRSSWTQSLKRSFF